MIRGTGSSKLALAERKLGQGEFLRPEAERS